MASERQERIKNMIKKILNNKEETQKSIAKFVGLNHMTIWKLLNTDIESSVETLNVLERYLKKRKSILQ